MEASATLGSMIYSMELCLEGGSLGHWALSGGVNKSTQGRSHSSLEPSLEHDLLSPV